MTKAGNGIGLALLAVALAGCSMGSSLLGKPAATQAPTVQVGNDLTMPPDLQLPPPGQAAAVYQQPVENGGGTALDAGIAAQKPSRKVASAAVPTTPMAPLAPPPDIYEQNGISKVNADGTPKAPEKLRVELQAALLKKKQQKNPSYGTIRNIGNIFSDQ